MNEKGYQGTRTPTIWDLVRVLLFTVGTVSASFLWGLFGTIQAKPILPALIGHLVLGGQSLWLIRQKSRGVFQLFGQKPWLSVVAYFGVGLLGLLLVAKAFGVPYRLHLGMPVHPAWSTLLLAPISEELYFRGLAYPVLSKYVGKVGAATISSAVFALLHLTGVRQWLFLVAAGLILCAVVEESESTGVAITLHMLINIMVSI